MSRAAGGSWAATRTGQCPIPIKKAVFQEQQMSPKSLVCLVNRVQRDVPLLLRTLKQSLCRRLPAPTLRHRIQIIIVILIVIVTTIELIPRVPREREPVISGTVDKQDFGAGRFRHRCLVLVLLSTWLFGKSGWAQRGAAAVSVASKPHEWEK